jgi:hypothetical protein
MLIVEWMPRVVSRVGNGVELAWLDRPYMGHGRFSYQPFITLLPYLLTPASLSHETW